MIRKSGFTLIEVMIVVTILSLVMASLAGLFEGGMKSWKRVNTQSELQQNLRFALTNIISDIRKTENVDDNSTSEVLILQMPDTHSANTIEYGLKTDEMLGEHQYNLSGQVLYKRVDNGDREPVANFIQSIEFIYDPVPEDTSYVTVTISGNLPNGKELTLKTGAEIKWKSLGLDQE